MLTKEAGAHSACGLPCPPQIGILGVKGSYTSPLVIPLLFITAIVAYVCRGVFERPFQVVSLRGAVDLDNHEKVGGTCLEPVHAST